MMRKQRIVLSLTVVLVLVLQACNLPSGAPTEEPTPDPLVAAQLTITALAEQNPPTEAIPTFTALPSLSPTPEFTSTPAFTQTPAFAYLTLSQATNCRVGSAVEFELVDTFQPGQTIEVVGKHPFDNYWYVRSPNNPGVYCWMWGAYAPGANLNNVPILTPPATYTPVPTATATSSGGVIIPPIIVVIKPSFTASYVNQGKCLNWWARIAINNSGMVDVKSISISLKDTITNKTSNSSLDGFQDVSACALTQIIPTLAAGQSTTVVSPSLSDDPTGHKLSATITLCTQPGLGGGCSSSTIEFTP